MSDDTDRADGAHDLEQLLDGALDETAVLRTDASSPGVLLLPVTELPASPGADDRLDALASTVDDRNEDVRELVRTLERQQTLLADLTARVGDLEARLEVLASAEE